MKNKSAFKIQIFSLIGFVMCFQLADAQIAPPVILPPSPQASALISYNAPEVGLNTGTTQLSIPLFKIEKLNFSMPIGLRYSTNGMRVDEIATRTGQSWVLNSGGVITRSVNGRPDEYNARSYPPNDGTAQNNALLTYLKDMSTGSGLDGEPDEYNFNFNGYSGKFIIDGSGQPLLMPHNNIKIIFPSGIEQNITIITPDGVKYEFGAREKSYINTFCYVEYTPSLTPVVTSWFLTRITLNNGEEINLTYTDFNSEYYTGMSQTVAKTDNFNNYEALNCNSSCALNQNRYCANYVASFSKRLSNISYDNVQINFLYQDRLDIPSDKLLSSVELRESGQLRNKFNFEYTYSTSSQSLNIYNNVDPNLKYRPFLTTLKEKGSSLTEEKVHRFEYNDIQSLPPRLSFSQDHYGFYNGKDNLSFVPNVTNDPRIAAIFQFEANADRSVNGSSSQKGVLTKVTYPGGGSDRFVYESNTYSTTEIIPPPTTVVGISGTSGATVPLVKNSANFQFTGTYPSVVTYFAGMLIPTDGEGQTGIDPDADLMQAEILRSSDGSQVFTATLKLGQQINQSMMSLDLNTDYYIKITVLYPGIKGISNIGYTVGTATTVTVNKETGGVRLREMITDSGNGPLVKKRYHYASINALNTSSGVKFREPEYLSTFYSLIYPCTNTNSWAKCMNLQLSSHSQKSIYDYGQSSIQYQSVTESFGGDNFENGGIEHLFLLEKDRFSNGIVGQTLSLGDKYSNTGYRNGFEYETNTFRKIGSTLEKIKGVKNYHSVKGDITTTVPAYVVNKFYDFPLHYTNPIAAEFEGFQMFKYTFNSRWVVLDSTVTKDYLSNGDSLSTKELYAYNNSLHMQPTSVTSVSSKNLVRQALKNYPSEMVALGKDPSGVYAQMVAARNLTPLIEETNKVNNQQVSFTRTNYINPYTGIFVPGTVDVKNTVTTTDEPRLRFHQYNSSGRPVSLSKENGMKVNYIWAYNGKYPVAEIKNADYSAIVSIKGASAISAFSLTYPDKAAVDAFVAAIKTGLPNAQITTATFSTVAGMTSQTDIKGQTTYYEYDNFQRLMNVKDQNGNIIKNYDYHYKP